MSADTLEAIGERHNLRAGEISPLEDVGIFNAIYLVGSEYILRIPRDAPPFVAAIRKESVAVPAARAAGVRTPALIAFDDSLDLLPVPYGSTSGCMERRLVCLTWSRGYPQGLAPSGPRPRQTTRRSGRVRTGSGSRVERSLTRCRRSWHQLDTSPPRRPAGFRGGWSLAPFALAPPEAFPSWRLADDQRDGPSRFANISCLIDWGACGWGDPAYDFAGIPLRAVPFMLEGYREVAPLPQDETAEARILWRHLQISLYLLGRPPQPGLVGGTSGGDVLEIMRFFLGSPGKPWRICTEPREPRLSGATRISQPVTRYLCDFGQAR